MGTLKVNGDISATGNISASSFLGNASSASKWATARTIKIGKTGKSVDGSSNVSWTHYEIGVPYCYDTSPTGSPAYSHWGMLISREENKYGQSGTGDNYFIGVNSNSQLHIGHQLNGTSVITWTNILSEHNYSSYALPLSGGTMSGSPVIKFPASAGSIAASDPMAITYGRISAYGTLCINADTDVSGGEYIILTAGKGLSSSIADGLAIGQSTLTWQGASVITSGNIGSQSVNYANSASSASWASGATYANSIGSTGFGDGNFTYLQTSGDFYGATGWAHYLIANHGNGATYYNYVIKLPFWGVPQYKYQTGNTSAVNGWYDFITSENYTSYCAPASHSHNYATLGAPNNLMHSGNEFTFAPAGYSGGIWFNYRTAGWDTNGNITDYTFGNGRGGLAPAVAQYFRTMNYGSGVPGTSTPGYNNTGAIYYQI